MDTLSTLKAKAYDLILTRIAHQQAAERANEQLFQVEEQIREEQQRMQAVVEAVEALKAASPPDGGDETPPQDPPAAE